MASTYSPNLRIELITTGEQANTWGTTTNTNLGTLIEQAISGLVSVNLTASNATLTALNGTTDQSRQMIIVATGTPGVTRTITAPVVNKVYIVYNNTNATLNFIASGGSGVTFSAGDKKLIYCDGTNYVEAIVTTDSAGSFSTLAYTTSFTGLSDALINTLTIGQGSGGVPSNTAVGYQALNANTTGTINTAVGYFALKSNTTGAINTAVGYSALSLNTTGSNNSALGAEALSLNTTGASNTAVGYRASYANTTGGSNSALGFSALSSNTTGNFNIAVGSGALNANTTGGNNSALGTYALIANTTGASNTAVGYSALNPNTTGSNNVGIGFGAAASSATISNEVNIYNGSVTARFQGAATAWSFVSDARDKTAVENLPIGLNFITGLQPRKFQWDIRDCNVDKGKEALGFIAQEVLEVVNTCNAGYTGLVDTNNPDQYTLATGNLIPILVNAIKELTTRLEILEGK